MLLNEALLLLKVDNLGSLKSARPLLSINIQQRLFYRTSVLQKRGEGRGPWAITIGTVTILCAYSHSKVTEKSCSQELFNPKLCRPRSHFAHPLCLGNAEDTNLISPIPEPVFLCGQLELQLLPALR